MLANFLDIEIRGKIVGSKCITLLASFYEKSFDYHTEPATMAINNEIIEIKTHQTSHIYRKWKLTLLIMQSLNSCIIYCQ